jgi:hypothetical protein
MELFTLLECESTVRKSDDIHGTVKIKAQKYSLATKYLSIPLVYVTYNGSTPTFSCGCSKNEIDSRILLY